MPVDLRHPPVFRYSGPIIDAHCHFTTPDATERMIQAGTLYGVSQWVGICRVEEVPAFRERFGDRAAFTIWIDHELATDSPAFLRTQLDIIHRAVEAGGRCMKFWYKPEYNHRSGLFFDHPCLDPIFRTIEEAGLGVLVHIADPDVWWRHRYCDPAKYEAKRFTFRQLTNTLERFGRLRVLVAHLGGWPENLPFLENLLNRYPNCHLDTSGTKWIARELSAKPAESRDFIIRYADRLLFGSDLVAWEHADLDHHCSRYWVHRHLYEQRYSVPSPIEDPDAVGPVQVTGLDLPDSVLRRLYLENARRFYRLA